MSKFETYTGWSKKKWHQVQRIEPELVNFLKLIDWAVHWQVTLLGRTGGGNFQAGNISFAQTCI